MQFLRSAFLTGAASAALLWLPGCSGGGANGSQNEPLPSKPVFQHAFDHNRAFADLTTQCNFGPRNPGSPGHDRCLEWIKSEAAKTADRVIVQNFSAKIGPKTHKLANVIAVYGKPDQQAVLLAAHWDTRPKADQDMDPAKAALPIIGANDGASGVAVLMELGRLIKRQKPPIGVVMVFFDAEDSGGLGADWCLGSKYFASNWKKTLAPLAGEVRCGILLDMVGASDMRIPREQNSQSAAPELMDVVWSHAKKAGLGRYFPDEPGSAIFDDHVPLINAGLPTIDLISFDYAYWHTQADTPDKCSPHSLRAVGEVVARTIYGPLP